MFQKGVYRLQLSKNLYPGKTMMARCIVVLVSGLLLTFGFGCSNAQTEEATQPEPTLDAAAGANRIQEVTQGELVLIGSDGMTYLNLKGSPSVIESDPVHLFENYFHDRRNRLLLDFDGNTVCKLPEETSSIDSIDEVDETLLVTVTQTIEIDTDAETGTIEVLEAPPIQTNCETNESTILEPQDKQTNTRFSVTHGDKSFTIEVTEISVSVTDDDTGRLLIEDAISGVTFSADGEVMLYRKGDSIEAMDTSTGSIKWSQKHGIGRHDAIEQTAVLSGFEVGPLTDNLQNSTDIRIVDLETGETIDRFNFLGFLNDIR